MNNISEADVPALPPPSQPAALPGKQVDAEKIKRQYETLKKVAVDRAASENEKNIAKKKMSEFEKTYQDILKKHKGVPQGPATPPKPSSQPIVPTANQPQQQSQATNIPPPASPTPQPVQANTPIPPPVAPKVPTPPTASPVAPVAPAVQSTPQNNFSNTYNNLFPKSATPKTVPTKQSQPKQPSQKPYNIGQLQQQFQNVRPNTQSTGNAVPVSPAVQQAQAKSSGPGIISRVAAMPVKALQKGIGAYSKIVNAPRALGQSLKAAAAGEPYQLQQQIGAAAQKAGFTAVPPAEPTTPAAAQQYTKQQKIDDLVQRIRKNPNDQQAIMALKSL